MPSAVALAAAGEMRRRRPRLARRVITVTTAGVLLVAFVLTAATADPPPPEPETTNVSSSCLLPGAGTGATAGTVDPEQTENARVIISVGKAKQVPPRGWLVAVATALQESGLRNLPFGDHSSVGLFQLIAAHGSFEQRIDPVFSTTWFYTGLVKVPDWETLPVTVAAQSVQRSAFPDAYARWEAQAADIVTALSGVEAAQPCEPATTNWADGQAEAIPAANPRSTEQAIAWARAQVNGPAVWYRACLNFVAQANGWSFSGTHYAIDHFDTMPAQYKHTDRSPPPGALLYWRTGSRAGHVALYLGGGLIASNDIGSNGAISVVPASAIEDRWGASYAGWTPPYFPNGG